jgi:Cdc6-like AAA superfamily ATPase
MNDDIKEWIELTTSSDGKETPSTRSKNSLSDHYLGDEREKSGKKDQYALYSDGYKATTKTIKSLPPGIYDVKSDDYGVFISPALPPAGLLLNLPEMRSDEVIKTVENFWDSEKDYKDGNEFVIGGANYKAGIMLYGPAGSGKSCTIKLVCNKLIERGGTVFFSSGHPEVVCVWLKDFATIEPERKSIVILEDIDSLISNYGESQYLEMLDSAKTINNVLFIATTNYPENLDPRIYNRPGRFSHVIKIGLPTKKTREAYLKAILKNYRDVDYIVENSEGFTIDHLTALTNAVYREKKDLKSELERLRILFRVPKSDSVASIVGIGDR